MVDDLAGLVAAGAEAVTVSTPADTHIPLCRDALERGLPVVVDKPFALTAADARPAVELAERLGLALSVYQNRRWDSDFRTVRALADSGTLGEITRFESRFERRQDGPPTAGGGTLLDFGSHLVDQAIQLLGPVRTVYAEIHHRDDPTGLDDDVFVALTHARGAHSHLWGSWVQSAPGPRFRVTGTRATYVVDGLDIQEELLVAGRTPASEGGAWGTEPQDRWGRLHDGSGTASRPDRTRPLGHLLPELRRGRARQRPRARRSAGRAGHRRGARRRTDQRNTPHAGRPATNLVSPATGDEPKDVTDPAPARPRHDRHPLSHRGDCQKVIMPACAGTGDRMNGWSEHGHRDVLAGEHGACGGQRVRFDREVLGHGVDVAQPPLQRAVGVDRAAAAGPVGGLHDRGRAGR